MAVNNPDGSSVTVNQPPPASGGAPAYTGVKWTTEYEVDFADYFAANGGVDWCVAGHTQSHTLLNPGGSNVDWEAYADGSTALNVKTSALEINASGLQVGNPTNNGEIWSNNSNAPRVGPLIADAIGAGGGPAYDYYKDIVCMQAYVTSDVLMDDNWRNFGIVLNIHSASQFGVWLYTRANSSSNAVCASVVRSTGAVESIANPTVNPSLFEIIVGPRLASPRGRVSDWAGDFPEPQAPLVASGWVGAAVDASSVIKDIEGAQLASGLSNPTGVNGRLEVSSNTSMNWAGAFTMTVHKVRYLRLR